ncbi:branched-chain amino acid ABC transporter ATP-binding protein [Candidatus Caldarchaeum subterraneum]|uniref:Probable branched-chain amino acid transport ATP-binding protein LivG n=1 Tax=Caldiarchaeum subterraneum TaxID=311458 RepID=E6N8D5_CALS0|nr:branched-chain amino acid ABC transporter ATP-binding protein [Candidatus Caldarchaeum subterraneum]BAJ48600.1 branched-chain amino acid ABC transporter ATP-binding protein [Candidatus Caldarchaeum subterraneum]BAJ51308.1 branched-chain amino acid ABC transporter ATP-binding protein [Candidatus Caldarchaeum subterraneum]
MENIILDVRDVYKSFGGLYALNGASLRVKKGSLSLLIGPNGSGKTTLINTVTGVYKPEAGKIIFEDRNITGLKPHVIYKLGLVRTWQIPQPFYSMTVLENLLVSDKNKKGDGLLSALLRSRWIDREMELTQKAFEILKLLKLDHLWDHRASELSGGQMKLLETGRALMSGAKMILMDEPAAGLNPVLAHEVFTHLRNVCKKLGATLLLVEHRLDIAIPYVDHVYAMHLGKVIAEGEPQEVLTNSLVVESYLGG